jgi:DNA-binding transcriptional ArsR family regulator
LDRDGFQVESRSECQTSGTEPTYKFMRGLMGTRRRLPTNQRFWIPRSDRSVFLAGRAMPSLFGTFDRTELIAFLATYGATRIATIAAAFDVSPPSMSRRLRAAEAAGLLERCRGTADYYRLDRQHPVSGQIRRLARRLSQVYPIPALDRRQEVHAHRRLTAVREYQAVDVLRSPLTPVRGEILLLLSALSRPIPINYIAGILGRKRFSVCMCINAFETFGIVASTRVLNRRLVSLDRAFPAYRELRALLLALTRIDSQWRDYAVCYEASDGASVSYQR